MSQATGDRYEDPKRLLRALATGLRSATGYGTANAMGEIMIAMTGVTRDNSEEAVTAEAKYLEATLLRVAKGLSPIKRGQLYMDLTILGTMLLEIRTGLHNTLVTECLELKVPPSFIDEFGPHGAKGWRPIEPGEDET